MKIVGSHQAVGSEVIEDFARTHTEALQGLGFEAPTVDASVGPVSFIQQVIERARDALRAGANEDAELSAAAAAAAHAPPSAELIRDAEILLLAGIVQDVSEVLSGEPSGDLAAIDQSELAQRTLALHSVAEDLAARGIDAPTRPFIELGLSFSELWAATARQATEDDGIEAPVRGAIDAAGKALFAQIFDTLGKISVARLGPDAPALPQEFADALSPDPETDELSISNLVAVIAQNGADETMDEVVSELRQLFFTALDAALADDTVYYPFLRDPGAGKAVAQRIREDVVGQQHVLTTEAQDEGYAYPESIPILDRLDQTLVRGELEPGRPAGSFLLAGPEGSGRNTIADVVARHFRLERFELNGLDLQNPKGTAFITGESTGQGSEAPLHNLRHQLLEHPKSLILVRNLDGAHPEVLDALDQARTGMLEGMDLTQSVLVATVGADSQLLEQAAYPLSEVQRFDGVFVLNPTSPEDEREIIEREIHGVLRALGGSRSRVEVAPEAIAFVQEQAEADPGSPSGSRAQHLVDDVLAAPLNEVLGTREADQRVLVTVSEDGTALQFDLQEANDDRDAP